MVSNDLISKSYLDGLMLTDLSLSAANATIDSTYKSIWISLPGSPTGTFTLSFGGQTTAPIPTTAAGSGANSVQSALEALSTIGVGNVVVGGLSGGPWTVTLQGTLAGTAPANSSGVGVLTANTSGLTGAAYGISITWLATQTYVTAEKALKATKAYVDGTGVANPNGGDAGRLKLSQLGLSGGVAGLTAGGRMEVSRIVYPTSVQRYPKPFVTPISYFSAATNITTETQIFSCPVADPGFTYKLLVMGMVDAGTSVAGSYSVIRARLGNQWGTVLAQGYGLAETYRGGISLGTFTTAGTSTFIIPSWVYTLDVIALGGGGGGMSGGSLFVAPGVGGSSGSWNATTLTSGGVPSQVTISVGAGGGGGSGIAGSGSAGGATTITWAGQSTPFSAGGGAGASGIAQLGRQSGKSPGNYSFDGNTYSGGGSQGSGGATGNSPGGGGAGGDSGAIKGLDGGAGAPGAVWLFGWPLNSTVSGPANLLPADLNSQTPMTGAATVVVTLGTSDLNYQILSPLRPSLYVVPVPA